VLIDGREVLVVGIVFRKPGHVANLAVRVVRPDQQRLFRVLSVTTFGWKYRDLLKLGLILLLVSHALANPAEDGSIGIGILFETLPALVVDLKRGFLEQQAFLGIGGEDASATSIFDDVVVVALRIVGKDRELESILAFGLCVAAAIVAAALAEHGQDVLFETHAAFGFRLDGDRNRQAASRCRRSDGGFAWFETDDFTVRVNCRNVRFVGNQPGVGEVGLVAVCGAAGDDNRVPAAIGAQGQGRRERGDGLDSDFRGGRRGQTFEASDENAKRQRQRREERAVSNVCESVQISLWRTVSAYSVDYISK
jgi:hypothetical protein